MRKINCLFFVFLLFFFCLFFCFFSHIWQLTITDKKSRQDLFVFMRCYLEGEFYK